jgi:Cohesin domain
MRERGIDRKKMDAKLTNRVWREGMDRSWTRHRSGVSHGLSFALLLALLFLRAAPAWGVELQIPSLKGKAGQEIKVPLVLDQVGNLAGVKLVLHYDKDILVFKEGSKSEATQSLMHIINDKTPGKLIIVMAGARGIQGKEITILALTFGIKKGVAGNHAKAIEISEV